MVASGDNPRLYQRGELGGQADLQLQWDVVDKQYRSLRMCIKGSDQWKKGLGEEWAKLQANAINQHFLNISLRRCVGELKYTQAYTIDR